MTRAVIRQVAGVCASVGLLAAAPAQAQDPRIEIGASAGWTLSDGVTFDGVIAGDGNVYNSIEPKDSFSYNLQVGFFVNPHMEIGFLFDQQKTTLVVGGTQEREIGDMSVNNYHGFFAYHFGDPDAKARPYFLGGAGATSYGKVPFDVGNFAGETGSATAVLDHLGARREALSRPQGRPEPRRTLDADLHQVGCRRLVVRSVLGLLRRRRLAVLEPVRALGRARHPLLRLS